MPSLLMTKSAALLACLAVLAAPAFGVAGWRCADGQPCPLTTVDAERIADPAHTCCPPQPCDQEPLPRPDPIHCVLETGTPADWVEQRTTADLTVSPVFALAPLSRAAVPPPARVWAVVTADEAPPVFLSPKQGPSPRAPPAGR